MIPFLGFTPDADPTLPGVLTDVSNCIPSDVGMEGAPSDVTAINGLGALAAACRGSAVVTKTSGARRFFAGTQTNLYEQQSTAWTAVSRGGAYTGSSESRWIFDQFGDTTLATNDVEKIQASSSGAFADVTAAPVAKVVFTTDNFVIALNTNETTYGDSPDRWWCCAYQDHTSWTANVTTQATTGRLIGDGGELVAGLKLGPYAVAYKSKSIFLGSYVGAPVVWQWERIPDKIGCVGPEALSDIGGAHVFVGDDNIWLFDGTRPQPIATGQVREWWQSNSSATYRYKTIVRHDRPNQTVWFFFPSGSSVGTIDAALVWHIPTRRWGRADRTIEAAVNFITPSVTWDTLSSFGATWDTLTLSTWDSPLLNAGGSALAVFNASHYLMSLTGASSGGSITTGDFGDDYRMSQLQEWRLRFNREPTSATAAGQIKRYAGDGAVLKSSATMRDGKFSLRQSGRYHRLAATMTGPFEVVGHQPLLVNKGRR